MALSELGIKLRIREKEDALKKAKQAGDMAAVRKYEECISRLKKQLEEEKRNEERQERGIER